MTIAVLAVQAAALAIPMIMVAVIALAITMRGTQIGLAVVRLAVRLLPERDREVLLEEWSADVLVRSDNGRHDIAGFLWALGTTVAAVRRSGALARLKTGQFVGFMVGLVVAVAFVAVSSGGVNPAFGVPFMLSIGLSIALGF